MQNQMLKQFIILQEQMYLMVIFLHTGKKTGNMLVFNSYLVLPLAQQENQRFWNLKISGWASFPFIPKMFRDLVIFSNSVASLDAVEQWKLQKEKIIWVCFQKKSGPTSATIESEILNPSFKIIISGGILNYVSHVMFNAVNYLTTQRPLNFTLYCRHDLQVDLFKPSCQLNSWCLIHILREIYLTWQISDQQ